VFICDSNLLESGVAPMSAMIDEDGTGTPRRGNARGFAGGPPDGSPGDREDLWRRLLFTLGALVVYRVGHYLPIPGLDLAAIDALRRIDFFAGGISIPDLSIFSLGIMPYISAFIIVQLASRIFPRLGGSTERVRLGNLVRILTMALAAFEAAGAAASLESIAGVVIVPGPLFMLMTIVSLVAGTLFLMWLAEQITVHGIGDGALVILACSILGRLPFNLSQAFEAVRMGAVEIASVFGALSMVTVFLAFVVFVERSERRIPLYDPGYEIGQGRSPGRYSNVPLRINPAGVLPALAAAIFVAPLLQSIAAIGGTEAIALRYFSRGSGFDLLYGALIVVFAVYFNFAILEPRGAAKRPTESQDFPRSLHVAVATCYVAAVCVLPLTIYRWTVWPFLLSGFQIFLVGWVMVRILERVRTSWPS